MNNQPNEPNALTKRLVACALCLLLSTTLNSAADRQVLRGHMPAAVREPNVQPTARLSATNELRLAIGLPLRNPAALTALLAQLYDPTSPQYHQYLTVEEFTERFGPTKDDYEAVIAFAGAQGLKVTARHPNRL